LRLTLVTAMATSMGRFRKLAEEDISVPKRLEAGFGSMPGARRCRTNR